MKAWVRDMIGFINGFRKWSLMFLVLVTGIVFRIVGLVNGEEFKDLIVGTYVAFAAGNGLEHMTSAVKEWVKKKSK